MGDILHINLSSSVEETVKKRIGIASMSTFDIRAVVDDRRSNAIGALSIAFEIYEMALIPSLLNNAGTWEEVSKKTLKTLEKFQCKFIRVILAVGTGCPKPMLYSQTGMLLMENRVLTMKALFLHHAATLPPDSLARNMYEYQVSHNIGLVKEMETPFRDAGINDIQSYSKGQFKQIMKNHFFKKNKNDILSFSRKYKKVNYDDLCNDDFKMKSYFKSLNLSQARLKYKINSKMTNTVANNYR